MFELSVIRPSTTTWSTALHLVLRTTGGRKPMVIIVPLTKFLDAIGTLFLTSRIVPGCFIGATVFTKIDLVKA